jgi:hypothetical protein
MWCVRLSLHNLWPTELGPLVWASIFLLDFQVSFECDLFRGFVLVFVDFL